MEGIIYEEMPKVTRRQQMGVLLWGVVLGLFALLGLAWYFLLLVGVNLLFELWNIVSFRHCRYVLYWDRLVIHRGDTVAVAVPFAAMEGVYRGSFRELLKVPQLKAIPVAEIQAVPKLGRSKELVAVVFREQVQRAVFIQPSLTLQLVLEEKVSANAAGSQYQPGLTQG